MRYSLLISESVGSKFCFLSKALSVACCAWGECVSTDGPGFTQQSLAAVMVDHSKNTPYPRRHPQWVPGSKLARNPKSKKGTGASTRKTRSARVIIDNDCFRTATKSRIGNEPSIPKTAARKRYCIMCCNPLGSCSTEIWLRITAGGIAFHCIALLPIFRFETLSNQQHERGAVQAASWKLTFLKISSDTASPSCSEALCRHVNEQK